MLSKKIGQNSGARPGSCHLVYITLKYSSADLSSMAAVDCGERGFQFATQAPAAFNRHIKYVEPSCWP